MGAACCLDCLSGRCARAAFYPVWQHHTLAATASDCFADLCCTTCTSVSTHRNLSSLRSSSGSSNDFTFSLRYGFCRVKDWSARCACLFQQDLLSICAQSKRDLGQ